MSVRCSVCGVLRESADGVCPACLLRLGLPTTGSGDPAMVEDSVHADLPTSYRVVAVLGGTPGSTVYLAEQATSHAVVAVKVLTDATIAGEQGAHFGADLAALRDLRHPHIATVFDGGVTRRGHPWLVSEFVPGRPIDRYCGGLSPAAVLALIRDTCRALGHADDRGLAHGHVVASNVIVSSEREAGTVKITDFAQAHWRGKACTRGADLADLIGLARRTLPADASAADDVSALLRLPHEALAAPGAARRLGDAIDDYLDKKNEDPRRALP